MVGIIDYNAGNIRSVEHALNFLGVEHIVSKKPNELEKADRVIFPGVGNARYAMEQLVKSGYDLFLRDFAESGKPILGICLGSQIIFDHSDEGDVECLGLVSGTIRQLSAVWRENDAANKANNSKLKVPHMGWNDVHFSPGALFDGIPQDTAFYFVHSYVICPKEYAVIAAVADYGVKIPAAIQAGNILALQFHPEKSGKYGLMILDNFASLPLTALDGAQC